MSAGPGLYIGLMSGTSADGLDAGLFSIGNDFCQLKHAITTNIPPSLRQNILRLCQPGNLEIDQMGALDSALGTAMAEAAMIVIREAGVNNQNITAIGSHGQTIRHRPDGSHPFTLQIGDPNRICALTGIPVVADLRRRDIAEGGQGAPLAPAFHQAVFSAEGEKRAVINIGGMANITILNGTNSVLGYDSGPGNVLMDTWIQQVTNQPFDNNGEWAKSGAVDERLLAQLLAHPFLKKAYPKSTGREEFDRPWLEEVLRTRGSLRPEDIQATLLSFTVQSIAIEVSKHQCQSIFLCGGGANNHFLQEQLVRALPTVVVQTTESLGIPPDFVEVGLCAWIAAKRIAGEAIDLRSVTGAKRIAPLGALYSP